MLSIGVPAALGSLLMSASQIIMNSQMAAYGDMAVAGIGVAMPSLIINISRQGLLYIPVLFLLNSVLGVTGLVWAQPIVDVIS